MKKLFLFALAALCSTMMFAQKVTVTGTVTSKDDGQPIPGTNVQVKGTKVGAFTDEKGKYSIAGVPANATLVFSSIGFTTEEVAVGGRAVINLALSSSATTLDETIVVAYGTVKKGSYSGSATVVKQDAIKDAPVVSFEQVLAGKAAGVQVASYSGQPGSQVEINVRGFGSFNAGNQPLYVIDGVPATSGDYGSGNISTSAMNYLNPSDVESITILKDAAAASLYGSRASNGVVLITTKKGKAGDLTSTFKASLGVSYFAYNNYPECSDSETEELERQKFYNYGQDNPTKWRGTYASLDDYTAAMLAKNYPARDYTKYIYKDWEKVLFQKGVNQTYEYSITGGGEKGKVYASIAYTDQGGVIKIDKLQRFSTTINMDAQAAKRVKIGATLQYSWQYQDGHQDGWSSKDNPFFIWKVVLTDRWPYKYKDSGDLYLERMSTRFNTINPVASYNAQVNDAWQNRLMLKGWAEATITDYLKVKTILSNDWEYEHDRFAWLYGHPNFYAYSDIGGYASDRHRNDVRMVSSTTANFDKTFGKHHVSAMLGWEAERDRYKMTSLGKIDFKYLGATESYLAANFDDGYSYSREEGLLSLISNLNYDYDAKYYVTGTFRRDGSSRLAPSNRWGNFWSVSGSWRFANEEFLKKYEWINDGKLRGSYGTSGTLPSSYFGYMAVYDYGNYGQQGASYPSNVANTDLTWEKNKNWNLAIEGTIFDRYSFTAEYYSKKTTDLLLDATVPSTTGFSTSLMNIGAMVNHGWELSVNVDILKKKDYDLSVGANWATVHNEVKALSQPGEEIVNDVWIWKQGYSFYQFYTRQYLGVNKETGAPMYAEGSYYKKGDVVSQDVTLKNGKIIKSGETMPCNSFNYTPTTRQKASSMIIDGKTSIPKGYGGFNANFRWKDLTFSMAWSYKYGGYIWDGATDELANDGYRTFTQPILKSQRNTWRQDNTNGDIPRRILGNNQGGYYNSTRYLHRDNFMRLKNMTVSYSLPKKFVEKLTLKNARVYVAGTNLVTISNSEIDPEVQADGNYNYQMPMLRTFTFGIEVSF